MRRLILSALAVLALARPAFAQPRLFVTGDVFAEVKRFSGETASLPLDGNAFGAGARIGVALTPQWTAELGVDVGRFTTNIRDLTIVLRASPVRRQTRTQSQLTATSARSNSPASCPQTPSCR